MGKQNESKVAAPVGGHTELLPCPFCGNPPELETTTDPDEGCHCVACGYCDFSLMGGPVGIGWWPTQEEAVAQWNRRATGAAS